MGSLPPVPPGKPFHPRTFFLFPLFKTRLTIHFPRKLTSAGRGRWGFLICSVFPFSTISIIFTILSQVLKRECVCVRVCVCVCVCARARARARAQSLSFLQLCEPMDCSPLASSVHRMFQARILEWVVTSYPKESYQPRDRNCVSCISCIGR